MRKGADKILKFIERYENLAYGFGLWLATALFIIFVRDGIECFISTRHFAFPDAFHLLHVQVFFISLLLFIIIILHFSAKTSIQKVSKICLIPFSIILLPVILDSLAILLTKSKITYGYISDNLWLSLLRFSDPSYPIAELPCSIRLEISLITLISFGYIFLKRRKFIPSFLGAMLIYVICVFYVAIPAVLIEVFKLLAAAITFFQIKNFPLPEGVIDENAVVLLQLLATCILALIWLWRYNRNKFLAVLRNMRAARSIHYGLLCLLGVLVYCLRYPLQDLFMLIRAAGAILAVFFAFQFSVVTNDIFDIECDKVSNAQRPLITQILDKNEYLVIGYVYLAFSLLFAFWVNAQCVMITLLFIAFYYLYSAPPLRLKRFFPLSALIIGMQAVFAFAVGNNALVLNEAALSSNANFFWPIFVIFSLASNVKDLKDIEGDKRTGVATLPVLLGNKTGRSVIAFLLFLSYCLVPYFLHYLFPQAKVLVLSICFALISFFYIIRKNAQEKIIFILYFIYTFLLIVNV